jgi:hypothetical protein
MIAYEISFRYMLAGYAVILITLTIYIVSLFIRWQRLKRELETFKDLERQQKQQGIEKL